MLLTVSKRLEFSASRRLFVPGWSENENQAAFGTETAARFGVGRNYVAYFVFAGEVDPVNGMLMNISELKERASEVLQAHFDHKFLNGDNPAFAEAPPTPENVARALFLAVDERFRGATARLVACHLSESGDRSATYYRDASTEANYWFEFSAGGCTISPHLSEEENKKLFGEATRLHGHNYRCRITFRREPSETGDPIVRSADIERCLEALRSELDYRNLNTDLPPLRGSPVTTETIALLILERCQGAGPVSRVRLLEREDFFAEAWRDDGVFLGMRLPFFAAHRLHVATLSETENVELYGKCHNPAGHGHQYLVEATVAGELDPRSGTVGNFSAIRSAIEAAIRPWQNRHLDIETADFSNSPSTGENIVRALWPRLDAGLSHSLVRLRLWETPNNRFTLRRNASFPVSL
jgi:6-pyruvoyltetrahydropterin/6-carboxytetrahydropterin synthase